MLKPSEHAPTVSQALADLIPRYLDTDAVSVIQGGPETVTQLLDMRWDHIMFTGGTRIGRIVAQAAAKYMTPITLELGGKCPVIIDESTNIEIAAKRILYGRQNNAGQETPESERRGETIGHYHLLSDYVPGTSRRVQFSLDANISVSVLGIFLIFVCVLAD